MESKSKNIRNLNQGGSPKDIPSGFEWDAMQEGIFQKMESLEASMSPKKNKGNGRRKVLLWTSALSLLSFSIFLWNAKNQIGEKEINQANQPNTTQQDQTPFPNTIDTLDSLGKVIKPRSENMVNESYSSVSLPTLKRNKPVGKNSKIILSANLNKGQEESTVRNEQKTLAIGKSLRQRPWRQVNSRFENILSPSILNLDSGKSSSVTLESSKLDTSTNTNGENQNFKRDSHSKFLKNELILEGGLVFWEKFKDSEFNDQGTHESTLLSYQFQGLYQKRLRQNFFLVTGIQYQQLESVFRYNTLIDDYKVILEDTIIRVENDLISGRQTAIYGDVEASTEAERRVIHYNQSRLLRITLGLGRTWQIGNFQGDVFLGGAINSLSDNRGRAIYQNEIIEYAGASNVLYSNELLLDAMAGIRAKYPLKNNLALSSSIQWQKSLYNWSAVANTNIYPASLSLQIGMCYLLP